MNHFFKESFWGRIINQTSGHKLLPYPEEKPDFVVPEKYLISTSESGSFKEKTVNGNESESASESASASASKTTSSNKILVDWYGDNDPENPYNWSLTQKTVLLLMIMFLTVSIYVGSAVYTPGIDELMLRFNVTRTVATVPLTTFVIGYGIGPLFLSPLTESETIGRNNIYIISLFIFFILQIPTALINNIPGLCVIRLIAGIFSSPVLSTGGASIGDIITFPYFPCALAVWAIGAVLGPSLSPLIGGAFKLAGDSVDGVDDGWRWPFWFMTIISGTCFVFLSLFLPETYGKTILYRRAQRLRAITGNNNIVTEDELNDDGTKSTTQLIISLIWRPMEITIMEPVVLLINLYCSLIYAILYLWFEAFPIVFFEVHQFTIIQMGLTYISIAVGVILGSIMYVPYIYMKFTKVVLKGDAFAPETFLPPSIVGSFCISFGMIIFGWTSSPEFHWFPPMIGSGIFAIGALLVFQSLFSYMGGSFFRYVASAFASNAFFRSVTAGCFPLFARPLFENTGSEKFPVGWGSTILGFIALAMCLIPILFYIYGVQLRAKSKYAN